MFLLEQGIRVTGTDAWSWDAPFDQTAARYAESGDASLIWEGHKAGAILATAISKSCTTLRPCPLAALPSAASRTKFGALCGLDQSGGDRRRVGLRQAP